MTRRGHSRCLRESLTALVSIDLLDVRVYQSAERETIMNKEFLEYQNDYLKKAIESAMKNILEGDVESAYNSLYFAVDRHSAEPELIEPADNKKDI